MSREGRVVSESDCMQSTPNAAYCSGFHAKRATANDGICANTPRTACLTLKIYNMQEINMRSKADKPLTNNSMKVVCAC